MSEQFEQAENYIKELLAVPIELTIQDINSQIRKDREVPGLILMVTGGQAIQNYFLHSPPLRTHDFDLKLISPAAINYTPAVRSRMTLLSKAIGRYVKLSLDNYIKNLNIDLEKVIKDKFGLILLLNDDGNIFTASTNPKTNLLNVVTFKIRDEQKIRTNSIVDIYVVDPTEIDKHFNYWEFTGLAGSNEILSENAGNYYIPFKMINGVPYAGMGYIIWDTYRMVKESKERGLPKHARYVQKRDAILNALNNPLTKVSCNALKDYMLNCEQKYRSCLINQQNFQSVDALIGYGVSEGVLPADPDFIQELRKTYDIDYLCQSLKRLL